MKNILVKLTGITIFLITAVLPGLAQESDNEAENVKKVLLQYNSALEALDMTGTESLFVENSQILETGKVEGTYEDYINHHIGPELGHFKSFTFSDYKVDVIVDLPYAFTTESYIYTIVLKEEEKVIKSQGVSTTVLIKVDGNWKIMKSHNSSRKLKQ